MYLYEYHTTWVLICAALLSQVINLVINIYETLIYQKMIDFTYKISIVTLYFPTVVDKQDVINA